MLIQGRVHKATCAAKASTQAVSAAVFASAARRVADFSSVFNWCVRTNSVSMLQSWLQETTARVLFLKQLQLSLVSVRASPPDQSRR